MRRPVIALLIIFSAGIRLHPAADYTLDEQSLNAGGRPAQAVIPTSAHYRVTLESIAEPLMSRALSSASFTLQSGFVSAFTPPGEVAGLVILADHQALTWLRESASTGYNVYTGSISSLPGGYGICAAARVAGTSWSDAAEPAPGAGVFYLVTGVNRLREEGTKGYASGGAERGNPAPCP